MNQPPLVAPGKLFPALAVLGCVGVVAMLGVVSWMVA